MVVTLQNFAHVERLVLLHLLFHQVFHDTRVKVLACFFVRHMVLFRVVEQGLIIAVLPLTRELGRASDLLSCTAWLTLAGILRVALPRGCGALLRVVA